MIAIKRAMSNTCLIVLLTIGGVIALPGTVVGSSPRSSLLLPLSLSRTVIGTGAPGSITVRYAAGNTRMRQVISGTGEVLRVPRGTVVRLAATPASGCQCRFRWVLSGNRGRFHSQPVTRRLISFTMAGATQVNAEYVKVSGDISLVPPRQDVVLQPLAASQVRVSPFAALDAARAAWKLTNQAIDQQVGVVRALLSVRNDLLHQDIKAWIVVGSITTYCPAPGCNTVYSKMVIVIDATTGKALFSYPVVASPTPAMGPPPLATPPPPGVYPPGSASAHPTMTPPPTPTPVTPGPWSGPGPSPTPTPSTAT